MKLKEGEEKNISLHQKEKKRYQTKAFRFAVDWSFPSWKCRPPADTCMDDIAFVHHSSVGIFLAQPRKRSAWKIKQIFRQAGYQINIIPLAIVSTWSSAKKSDFFFLSVRRANQNTNRALASHTKFAIFSLAKLQF